MTFTIQGLDPGQFAPLLDHAADPQLLGARRAEIVAATSDRGFPCRVSLEEARVGERVLLVNYTSLDKDTPFRASHAIYVREDAPEAASYVDEVPPMIDRRTVGLRGFSAAGYLVDGALAAPGEAATPIGRLLADPAIAYVDIHAAAYGCFLARAEPS